MGDKGKYKPLSLFIYITPKGRGFFVINLPEDLVKAFFLHRSNRFTVIAEKEGERVKAFLADPGRLEELLLPGVELYLSKAKVREGRKTAYDVVLLNQNGILISVDSRLPNRIFKSAFQSGELEPFKDYQQITSEVKVGSSRLDFLLEGKGRQPYYIEVKSVTLVIDGKGLFPDAPTARGSRHLKELMALKDKGFRTAVVFIIQRGDVVSFAPNENTDPAFTRILREAVAKGVEIYAYCCQINLETVRLTERVPVRLYKNS
ncbi:MAG: sugar fermentation stimulation protein [Clostridia bacterium]|nr:sugar fermentation stimulation protein [Clostridia bacterium]